MKKHLIAMALVASVLPLSAAVKPDAVLMTVDGRPVTVGEFEYLYNKNKTQQATPQSLEDYLVMFENYKLKVADAEHAGIDKTPAFENEYIKFRDDLAAPYLRDQATEDALVEEAYNHRKNDYHVSHIMLPNTPDSEARLDSIRNEIVKGNITFEDAARQFSVDRPSAERGGRMGYVTPDRYPWAFEKASYDTKLGEISPVTDSGVAFHLIRVESITPAKGDVEASHILLLTQGMDDKGKAAVKERIDSIYNALVAGADFAELATRLSQDPGSARRGGSLGRFSHGMMVAEFDSMSYATPVGQISKPFATSYGYHIVKPTERFDIAPLDDEMRQNIIARMQRDNRANMPAEAKLDQLMSEYHAKVDEGEIKRLKDMAAANGCDSTFYANIMGMSTAVATFDGGKVSVHDAMAYLPMTLGTDADAFASNFTEAARNALRNAVREHAIERLAETNTDYRNLINEYRDGILLYEISNQKVWDKAAKDQQGLKEFFEANRSKYNWESPKCKSYVFFAKSDSVLQKALVYADSLDTTDPAQFAKDLRKRYGRDLKVERVIAAKGENAITDYLGFNGDKEAADKQSKWPFYAAWHGRLVAQPEDASDVRGAAVTDYQAYLEEQWLKDLRKKYKIKLNKKVFKQIEE